MTYWMMIITIYFNTGPVTKPVSMWYSEEDCQLAAIQIMEHPDNKKAVLVECDQLIIN